MPKAYFDGQSRSNHDTRLRQLSEVAVVNGASRENLSEKGEKFSGEIF
jgi:hypothetical protein